MSHCGVLGLVTAAPPQHSSPNDKMKGRTLMPGLLVLLKALCLLLVLSATAAAQDFPTKTGRIIVPFPPGAINDTIGRTIATQLSSRLGKQWIVDNRPGAGGIIAYELAANAPKDGHTLLIVSSAMAVAPWMHNSLPFDTMKSFAPIAMIASAPAVVAANQNLPARTTAELIALAKKQPGKLQYASSGVGTFLHLAGELFKLTAGIDILHIPFKGAGPAMTDVIGGHTQLVFASIGSSNTHLRSGKLKGIAVGSKQRNALIPDVPTAPESGLPEYVASNWFGIAAPAGTPPAILARLQKEIAEIQNSPELQKQLATDGADIVRVSGTEFSAYIAAELAKWGRVVKEAGIKEE
jgi:tripartite-type tricarboxylate transporter receptor subunit TctC